MTATRARPCVLRFDAYECILYAVVDTLIVYRDGHPAFQDFSIADNLDGIFGRIGKLSCEKFDCKSHLLKSFETFALA